MIKLTHWKNTHDKINLLFWTLTKIGLDSSTKYLVHQNNIKMGMIY